MDPNHMAAFAAGSEPVWPDCNVCGTEIYAHDGASEQVHSECQESWPEEVAAARRRLKREVML